MVVDIAFKNQLVSVFKGAYLSPLNNSYTGYATKTTLALLTHLYENYTHLRHGHGGKRQEYQVALKRVGTT